MTEPGIDAVGALADPLRRRLYEYVVECGGGVSRADAASATGVRRTLAAFHLDKLADAGLLDVSRAKVSGREGPGSGRPAKLYQRARREHSVQLPPRGYEPAARLFAEAVRRSGAEEELYAAARAEGERQGAEFHAEESESGEWMVRFLEHHGYEPYTEEGQNSATRLRNCPFHSLARDFPPLTCGMNVELLNGVLEGGGAAGLTACLDPLPDGCCVRISKNKNY